MPRKMWFAGREGKIAPAGGLWTRGCSRTLHEFRDVVDSSHQPAKLVQVEFSAQPIQLAGVIQADIRVVARRKHVGEGHQMNGRWLAITAMMAWGWGIAGLTADAQSDSSVPEVEQYRGVSRSNEAPPAPPPSKAATSPAKPIGVPPADQLAVPLPLPPLPIEPMPMSPDPPRPGRAWRSCRRCRPCRWRAWSWSAISSRPSNLCRTGMGRKFHWRRMRKTSRKRRALKRGPYRPWNRPWKAARGRSRARGMSRVWFQEAIRSAVGSLPMLGVLAHPGAGVATEAGDSH